MLDRAERLQRQFFQHDRGGRVAWSPPVDITEIDGPAAGAGRAARRARRFDHLSLDPAGLTISAVRAFPCRGDTLNVHRIEIPYGRFERQIGTAARRSVRAARARRRRRWPTAC